MKVTELNIPAAEAKQKIRLAAYCRVSSDSEDQRHSYIQPGAEFYITIYGSVAQSESENISANVRWGKA